MISSPPRKAPFRPEIQGVRTVGAFLIAIFHIWLTEVSGGVDVFFVVSGFLMTGSLYREGYHSGNIRVFAFWSRIAKRVTPAAYTVLAITVLAAMLWMPLVRWQGFTPEIIASLLHYENLQLMWESVDYLAREEAPSPVQQFWALSVQIQFYVIWPFLMLCAVLIAARSRFSLESTILAVVGMAALASFFYSILQTAEVPEAAYFSPFTRIWEFALGGLCALIIPRIQLKKWMAICLSWLGLAAIISCGFVFSPHAEFPGVVALVPTLGAMMILAAGSQGGNWAASRILATKPMVKLGDLSYTFYLWHWPIFVFYLILSERSEASLIGGLGVIVASLAAAHLTLRWIERPVRKSPIGAKSPWSSQALALGFALPVAGLLVLWSTAIKPGSNSLLQNYRASVGQLNLQERLESLDHLQPGLLQIRKDLPAVYPDDCHQSPRNPESISCEYGNSTKPKHTLVLVGGSHSAQWLPALRELATELDWKIISITKSACRLESKRGHRSCQRWNEATLSKLIDLKPDIVVTQSTRTPRDNISTTKGTEFVPWGSIQQWKRLYEAGIPVAAIRDNPNFAGDPAECVEKNPQDLLQCARLRSEVMADVSPALEHPEIPANVSLLDLTNQLCGDELCPVVNENLLMYRDNHHLSATYVRALATPLGEQLIPLLNRQQTANSPTP